MDAQFYAVLDAWRKGAQVQYFVLVDYDSEWSDYEATSEPQEQPGRLAWRIKPNVQAVEQAVDKIGADRLAYEVARLVQNRAIDARSGAADALLDYLDVGGIDGPADVPTWVAKYEKATGVLAEKGGAL